MNSTKKIQKNCDNCVHIHQNYKCGPKYCDHHKNMYIPYPFWMYCTHHHKNGEIPLDESITIIDDIKYIIKCIEK